MSNQMQNDFDYDDDISPEENELIETQIVENKYTIKNDMDCDRAVARVKTLRSRNERYQDLIKTKIEMLKAQAAKYQEDTDGRVEYYKEHIKTYLKTVDDAMFRKTKAGSLFYDLSAGKISLSPSKEYTYDKKDPRFIEFVKSNNLPWLQTTEEVKWGDLKKELECIDDGMMVIKNCGVIIPKEIASYEEVLELKIS